MKTTRFLLAAAFLAATAACSADVTAPERHPPGEASASESTTTTTNTNTTTTTAAIQNPPSIQEVPVADGGILGSGGGK